MPGSNQRTIAHTGPEPIVAIRETGTIKHDPPWLTWLFALAYAALFIAAFAPLNLWPLILLAPAPLALLAVRSRSTAHALAAALLVSTVMWLWISRWLWQITELGLVPYALVMASWSVLFVWLVRRASEHRVLQRMPLALLIAVTWVGLEFIRGEIFFDGYPWFLLGHPLVEWPMAAQSADLFGTYFLSFIVALIAGTLVQLLMAGFARSRLWLAITAIVVASNLAYGYWRLHQTSPLSPGPSLLVIQTNMPQDNKMRSTREELWDFFQQSMVMTIDAHDAAIEAGEKVDLIIWPETMVTGWGFEQQTLQFFLERDWWPGYRFAMATEVAAAELGVPMLVGSPAVLGVHFAGEHHLDWDAKYNSAYLIEPPATPAELGKGNYQRYDKIFLTPFGETMPYIRAWPWLQEKMLQFGAQGMQFDLHMGDEPRVLDMSWQGQSLRLATPICFEATMAGVCRSLAYQHGVKRADIMINLTNDGWFGFHDPGRVQHAQIARLRAIENRVPMVRSANTGLSLSIDSAGRLVTTLGDGKYGISKQPGGILAEVQLDARQTLYGRIGDLWAMLCSCLVVVAVFILYWFK